jgi:WD repeat-containing protein 68
MAGLLEVDGPSSPLIDLPFRQTTSWDAVGQVLSTVQLEGRGEFFSVAWSGLLNAGTRLGASTFNLEGRNYLYSAEVNDSGVVSNICRTEMGLPATKVVCSSSSDRVSLVTSGEALRFWQAELTTQGTELFEVCRFQPSGDATNAFTSCDVCVAKPELCTAAGLNCNITVWDATQETVLLQLPVHDKSIYDVGFLDPQTIGSCGEDGSVRLLDIRTPDVCSVVFEAPDLRPLQRISFSQLQPHLISTFMENDSRLLIGDVRKGGYVVAVEDHTAALNAVAWSPHTPVVACSGEDGLISFTVADSFVGTGTSQNPVMESFLIHRARPINGVAWGPHQGQFSLLAAAIGNTLEVIEVNQSPSLKSEDAGR